MAERDSKEQTLSILLRGAREWNAWRTSLGRENLDLEGVHIGVADLSGVDLSGAILRDSGFSLPMKNPKGRTWGDPSESPDGEPFHTGALLTKANLQGAHLFKAYLCACDLQGANLESANLCYANVRGADLSQANLRRGYLSNTDFYCADFTGANLESARLSYAILSSTRLTGAVLTGADMHDARLDRANLEGADLRSAILTRVDLSHANLDGADLSEACLFGANLRDASFRNANLRGADLQLSRLINVDLRGADISGCKVHGTSVWDVNLDQTVQEDLVITKSGKGQITTDNIEIAQFLYLLLDNKKFRHIIDSITSKVVLILGRFSGGRKVILDRLRIELRRLDYLPVVVDFERPESRDVTETVSTLAHLSRFVIVDLTHPASVPQEITTIAPALAVPILPLVLEGSMIYSLFSDIQDRYPWVLDTKTYLDECDLVTRLPEFLGPAEAMADELLRRKSLTLRA